VQSYSQYIEKARAEQNLVLAVLGGSIGAVIGAVGWAAVTVVTKYQIGLMALAIGFLVGYLVRKLGKGVDTVFGITGAVLSLAGCLLGNLLAACGILSHETGKQIPEIVSQLTPLSSIMVLTATFQPMDLLFYGFAVYEGYKFSFRRLTQQELADLQLATAPVANQDGQ